MGDMIGDVRSLEDGHQDPERRAAIIRRFWEALTEVERLQLAKEGAHSFSVHDLTDAWSKGVLDDPVDRCPVCGAEFDSDELRHMGQSAFVFAVIPITIDIHDPYLNEEWGDFDDLGNPLVECVKCGCILQVTD